MQAPAVGARFGSRAASRSGATAAQLVEAEVVRWISRAVRAVHGVEPVPQGIGGGTAAASCPRYRRSEIPARSRRPDRSSRNGSSAPFAGCRLVG